MIGRHKTVADWPEVPAGAPLVQLRDVRKTYDVMTAPMRALRGVDLEIAPGEFVALAGASGSGKSTLLSVVAGLERHDDGLVLVAGLDLGRSNADQRAELRRRHVAIVFQFFRLLEQMTALENVAFAAQISGVKARAAHERAGDLLDQLGLLNRAADYPVTLSGGERQRLAIARALAARPSLLLADEPTGSLDSAGAAEIIDLLGELHDEGQTILLVTHDDSVAAAADRTVHLRDGQIVGAS
ncbi:MAG TPA: ABC transporter ATP-binding protein [Jatrophihabitans sp.]|jgi:putative ABC transport system ATP-binding protein